MLCDVINGRKLQFVNCCEIKVHCCETVNGTPRWPTQIYDYMPILAVWFLPGHEGGYLGGGTIWRVFIRSINCRMFGFSLYVGVYM